MTRYTELRHAGYYQQGLTDKDRQAIADKIDGTQRTTTPKHTTTSTKTKRT